MRAHILIRENTSRVREPERLEVLVHELGHFLGAVHSTSPVSAMRPTLGDGQARLRGFRISFDPDNAEIIRLVSREIHNRNIRRFIQLTTPTLVKLRTHYVSLAEQTGNDETAQRYRNMVEAILSQ